MGILDKYSLNDQANENFLKPRPRLPIPAPTGKKFKNRGGAGAGIEKIRKSGRGVQKIGKFEIS